MKYLLKMLKQPSTYAGMAAVASAATQAAAQGKAATIATVVMGLLAMFVDGQPHRS